MKILVNNQETETTAATVEQLAIELALPAKGVALAVNNQMVPRTAWVDTAIAEGANIVIIKAACGG